MITPLPLGLNNGVPQLSARTRAFEKQSKEIKPWHAAVSVPVLAARTEAKAQSWKPEAVHVKASELLANGKVTVRVAAEREKHGNITVRLTPPERAWIDDFLYPGVGHPPQNLGEAWQVARRVGPAVWGGAAIGDLGSRWWLGEPWWAHFSGESDDR